MFFFHGAFVSFGSAHAILCRELLHDTVSSLHTRPLNTSCWGCKSCFQVIATTDHFLSLRQRGSVPLSTCLSFWLCALFPLATLLKKEKIPVGGARPYPELSVCLTYYFGCQVDSKNESVPWDWKASVSFSCLDQQMANVEEKNQSKSQSREQTLNKPSGKRMRGKKMMRPSSALNICSQLRGSCWELMPWESRLWPCGKFCRESKPLAALRT